MSSTILRVKRRLEENPQDALVLMCKRVKKDTEEISPSLFVFRGTVDNQETTSVKDIVPKTETKPKPTHNLNDIIEKIRKERKNVSSQHRYEVVNCCRGLNDISDNSNDQFDLVDLEKTTDKESDVQYAYDLYTAEKQDFDVSMLDDLVCVENYQSDIIFGSYRDNGRKTPSSDEADDDDDSNDENNWRNDYPDSDHSIDEEDIIKAVGRCDIEDDLSSDTGEDNIYDISSDPFNEDVKRYGAAYAKYKAKVLAQDSDLSNGTNLIHCIRIDGEDSDGYKGDDDDGFYYGQEEDTDHFREQYGNDSSDPD